MGTAARIGGTLAELGGSIQGLGATVGTGLAKMGLKGIKLAGAAGAAEGAITGATNSDSCSDLPQNILTGSILGTISGAVGQKVLDSIIKSFSTKAATFGMKGGMENIINNPQAQNLVEGGIKQSNELAKQALRQIPQVSDRLNTQTADFMQQSLNHKINLPQTIASQRAKTQQYVNQHAADEVISFAPRKYFEDIIPESSFKPNYGRTKNEYQKLLQERASNGGKVLSKDIDPKPIRPIISSNIM